MFQQQTATSRRVSGGRHLLARCCLGKFAWQEAELFGSQFRSLVSAECSALRLGVSSRLSVSSAPPSLDDHQASGSVTCSKIRAQGCRTNWPQRLRLRGSAHRRHRLPRRFLSPPIWPGDKQTPCCFIISCLLGVMNNHCCRFTIYFLPLDDDTEMLIC